MASPTHSDDFLIGEQRSWPRAQTVFKALYADQEGYFREDKVLNVSKGGLFLQSRCPRQKGERLELILILPDETCEITVQGQIMHSCSFAKNPQEPMSQETLCGMGIMFTSIEPQLKDRLGFFIDRLFDCKGGGGGKRQRPRVQPPLNQVQLNLTQKEQSAVLCNLSATGMLLRLRDPVVLLEKMTLAIMHPDTTYQFELQGEIIHTQKTHDPTHPYAAGIRFINLDGKTQETIFELIREIMFRQQITRYESDVSH